jgi:hypothetical protein
MKRNWALLLARDFKTHDIIAFKLADGETTSAYTQLIKEVRKCGYVIWVVISDDCPAIGSLFEIKQIRKPIKGSRLYPRPAFPQRSKRLPRIKKGILYGIPHQLCAIHFKRNFFLKIVKNFFLPKLTNKPKRPWPKLSLKQPGETMLPKLRQRQSAQSRKTLVSLPAI